MAECKYVQNKTLECPICLEYFEKPIRQCVIGHSFCGRCLDPTNIKKCPECRSEVSETRNYKLEELLDTIPIPCVNQKSGCPYMLIKQQMIEHVIECRYRNFICEGKKFCGWKCNWQGTDLLEHFKNKHNQHTSMEYSTCVSVEYNNSRKFTDIQIIYAHYQLFWYKHKIDVDKKTAFWVIQYIGPRKQAEYYYYEFEIFNEEETTRKFKITEYCSSDTENINDIFESERCVAISFPMLKTYVNKENSYSFRFRLMKKPKPGKAIPKPVTQNTNVRNNAPVNISPNRRPIQYSEINGPLWLPMAPPVRTYRKN